MEIVHYLQNRVVILNDKGDPAKDSGEIKSLANAGFDVYQSCNGLCTIWYWLGGIGLW